MRSTARNIETGIDREHHIAPGFAPESAPESAPEIATEIGGSVLVERIARGGMADVFLAARADGRLLVVKRVLSDLVHAPRYKELLVAEAGLVARLRHPNIARVLDHGRDDCGAPFIAFEYVEGVDMRALLRACTQRKTPLPVAVSLYILREVLRALDHAHRARDEAGTPLAVVHRDVTPSNVLLGFDGDVKLCDFGIASAACMPPVPDDRIEGKTGYMSPEQARGRKLDKRSDVYAVGIMLWELSAGRRMRPEKGKPALRSAGRGEVPPLSLSGVHGEAELLAILRRALARSKKDRYASAGAMLRDLDAHAVAFGLDICALDLATWLARVLAPELGRAAELRARGEALAAEHALAIPEDRPSHSGPRRIRRALPRVRRRISPALALAAGIATLMLLWTLAWLAA